MPIKTEETLKLIPGVVENGVFAKRTADCIIIAGPNEVQTIAVAASSLMR